MLIGYFDESGTQAGSTAIAVAGALGSPEAWAYFEPRWQCLLAKYALPVSHMSAYETRRGLFEDWPDTRRLAFIKHAHRTITWNASVAIAAAVVLADYDSVVASSPFKKEVGSPYCLCIQKCLTQAVNWSRTHGGGAVVSFVFEDGAQGKGEVQQTFAEAKADKDWRPFLGTLEFRGKECLPLQAADIIAYEVWKQMVNQRVNGPVRDVRRSLYSILADLAFEDCYFDRDNLTELVGKIAAKKSGAAEQADEAAGALQ